MGIRNEEGFTILETTLFLAISGLLILMLIGGAGISLNVQRYHDATESFKAKLQAQYAALANVQNGRNDGLSCDSSARIIDGGAVPRGQTNCLLVGKYMRIDQSDVTVYTVLANQVSSIERTTDIEAMLNNYALNVSTTEVDEDSLDWGTQIAWPRSGAEMLNPTTPRTIGILFIRSPDSGLVYTFSSNDISPTKTAVSSSTLTDMIIAGATTPGQSAQTLCIDSGGLVISGDMAVRLKAFASSAAAVEVISNSLLSEEAALSEEPTGASQC
jgi:type II secretory pathway pseudopilin PulG